MNPLNPTSTQLCRYVQYLKNSDFAPTSAKNYLSGARTWIAEHGGCVLPFISFKYQQLLSGLTKRSLHVPRRAAPLTPAHISSIVAFLDSNPGIPKSAKPCILVGYHTFLRSSNLLSPSSSSWGGPHTLMAQDLVLSDDGLEISVYSMKTKKSPTPVKTFIPWGQEPRLCPAQAWLRYINDVKPWILGPAFVTDSHLPLTGRQLVGFMRLALKDTSDICPARVSMHSLRRGATQSALSDGTDLDLIQHRGMWSSTAGIAPYLA